MVMGILNVTPDSFSDGGRFLDPAAAVARACEMAQEGADMLDIGAQSTRPHATLISAEEEWARLAPVLAAVRKAVPLPLSVDTFYPLVAENALQYGADILNDVSGCRDNGFPALAARYGAGLVMMARDASSIDEVHGQLEQLLLLAGENGLPLSQVCLDIGIGFHASREVDIALIRELPRVLCGLPRTAVLCGASRKRVIAHAAGNCDTADRLGGTLAFHTAAQLRGATLLRVHDVKEAVQAMRVTACLR